LKATVCHGVPLPGTRLGRDKSTFRLSIFVVRLRA